MKFKEQLNFANDNNIIVVYIYSNLENCYNKIYSDEKLEEYAKNFHKNEDFGYYDEYYYYYNEKYLNFLKIYLEDELDMFSNIDRLV